MRWNSVDVDHAAGIAWRRTSAIDQHQVAAGGDAARESIVHCPVGGGRLDIGISPVRLSDI